MNLFRNYKVYVYRRFRNVGIHFLVTHSVVIAFSNTINEIAYVRLDAILYIVCIWNSNSVCCTKSIGGGI